MVNNSNILFLSIQSLCDLTDTAQYRLPNDLKIEEKHMECINYLYKFLFYKA